MASKFGFFGLGGLLGSISTGITHKSISTRTYTSNSFLDVVSTSTSTLVVNGKTYKGNSISYKNGKVIIDGKEAEISPEPASVYNITVTASKIESVSSSCSITVDGDVNRVDAGGSAYITGNVGTIDAGGSASITGDVGAIDAGGSVRVSGSADKISAGGSVHVGKYR